jgi:hypothetical protein
MHLYTAFLIVNKEAPSNNLPALVTSYGGASTLAQVGYDSLDLLDSWLRGDVTLCLKKCGYFLKRRSATCRFSYANKAYVSIQIPGGGYALPLPLVKRQTSYLLESVIEGEQPSPKAHPSNASALFHIEEELEFVSQSKQLSLICAVHGFQESGDFVFFPSRRFPHATGGGAHSLLLVLHPLLYNLLSFDIHSSGTGIPQAFFPAYICEYKNDHTKTQFST